MLTLFLGVCLGACSGPKKKNYAGKAPPASTAQKKPEAPPAWKQTLGRIALVNRDMSFVLVEIGTAPAPESGAALKAYSDNNVSAELVVSNYQRRPFLIADIVAGMPKVGDSIVLVGNRPTPDPKPLSRDEFQTRRLTPEPPSQVDTRTQFLPALSGEDSTSSRFRRNAEWEPPAPSAPAPAAPKPASEAVGALPPPDSSKQDSPSEAPATVGAEIIPGIPVSRRKAP